MKSYHNTTEASTSDLFEYEEKAKSQDEQVLDFMRSFPYLVEITCQDIQFSVLPNAPLTSARRALSNLFKKGLIEKVRKTKGSYGRDIFVWRLK